jgi:hypothetical protein
MKTINFWIHKNADYNLELVCIQIPAECCGIATKVSRGRDPRYQDAFETACHKHMGYYPRIWNYFVVDKIHGIEETIVYGRNCDQCKEFFPDAINNQSDSSFKCWACRHGW